MSLSPFSNPMTVTGLPRVLNMAAYLVVTGDVGLNLLNPGDTGVGKQSEVMLILLLYLYT
jgi:hypothetical protein